MALSLFGSSSVQLYSGQHFADVVLATVFIISCFLSCYYYDTIEKLLKVLLQCSFTVLVSFKTTATGISVYVKGLSNV